MGSYHLSCGFTNLSIGGNDQVVLIPLVAKESSPRGRRETCGDGSCLISNGGPNVLYSPFTLPIYGRYTDYGTIDQIEENENTKAIERFFDCTIQDFCDAICRPFDHDIKVDLSKRLGKSKPAATLIHRHVYDQTSKGVPDECGSPSTAYDEAYLGSHALKYIGFVEGERDPKVERYNIPMTHPEIKDFTVWTDKTFSEIHVGKKVESLYRAKDLHKYLIKSKRVVPTKLEEFKRENLSVFYFEYDKHVELFNSTSRYGMGFPRDLYGDELSDLDFTFFDLYKGLLLNSEIKSSWTGFQDHRLAMFSCNLIFTPSPTGPQCGNRHAEKARINIMKSMRTLLDKKYDDVE